MVVQVKENQKIHYGPVKHMHLMVLLMIVTKGL